MYGFSKYDAQDRYDSYNTVQVKLKLNMKTDADILAWVRQHKYGRDTSVQGAIKALIREDIARGQADGTQGYSLCILHSLAVCSSDRDSMIDR